MLVLRHGETDWNRNQRMQGWAPVPLNDKGREQAKYAGEWLRSSYEVDRIISSDLERTKETATVVRDMLDTSPSIELEPYWRERDLGVYQGLKYEDVSNRFPKFSLGDSGYEAYDERPDGGESFLDVYDRVSNRFDTLRTELEDETILVVSHGGPINLLLGHIKEMDVETALKTHHQSNCAVNEIDAITPDILRENYAEW